MNPVAYYRDTRYVLEENKRLTRRRTDTQFEEPVELELTDNCFKNGYFACMDVIGENDIAMLFVETASYNKSEVADYWLLRFDGAGWRTYKGGEMCGHGGVDLQCG